MSILQYLPHCACSKPHCWHLAPKKNKIQTHVCLQCSVQYNNIIMIPSTNGFSETNYNEIYKRNKIQYKYNKKIYYMAGSASGQDESNPAL